MPEGGRRRSVVDGVAEVVAVRLQRVHRVRLEGQFGLSSRRLWLRRRCTRPHGQLWQPIAHSPSKGIYKHR